MKHRIFQVIALTAAFAVFTIFLRGTTPASAGHGGPHAASDWIFLKFPSPQPLCTGFGLGDVRYWNKRDCGFAEVKVSNTVAGDTVRVRLLGPSGTQIGSDLNTTRQTDDGAWRFSITPQLAWEAGIITVRVVQVNAETGNFGETTLFLNLLGATVRPAPGDYEPGDPVPVTGRLFELWNRPSVLIEPPQETNVAGTFFLQVVMPSGEVRGPFGPFTANAEGMAGAISETLPGTSTAGLTATAETGFQVGASIEVVNASFSDPLSGQWAALRAGAGTLILSVPPTTPIVENSFVSSVGWVKPGQTYPFRVFVKNFRGSGATGAVVTLPAVDGTTFTQATPVTGSGSAVINGDGSITWTIGDVPAATDAGPAIVTLVVEARTDTLGQDPKIVWKDLSSTATLTYAGGPAGGLSSTSHAPKVIPPKATYDTARYGDRPFPVVPVDYFDRKHEGAHTGDALANKINSPFVPGSTFNLYQEMSYGQLFPHATVPSAAIASAGWDVQWNSPRYQQSGFRFTDPQPQGACTGTTFKELRDTAAYPERIRAGWYQLPGDTGYYGSDRTTTAGALVLGSGQIDSACGPIGKAVYDAAHIADPEIDYSAYDTDKDGVVDFFMMVFVGLGGNGPSQGLTLDPGAVPPYDNIWPHSTSLEFYYTDPETGQKGYVSDDQLKDPQGRLLYYTDASRTTMTTNVTGLPVYVRVGPYNVNPESAIDRASVISHEYGHSLGLPDFYSTGGRQTYGDWNLMATDKSQNMDVFSKQELGWIVPRVLQPGEATVPGWQDSKTNTHRIDWVQPDGTPYSLSGPNVNNGEGYVAKLPARRIIDPNKVAQGASPDHLWWSLSGNDFGCTPVKGHNLDIFLGELKDFPPGTPVTVTFKSYWDIEWDFDYGFVLVTTDGGDNYRSVPSSNGFSTSRSFNPNSSSCLDELDNGLTGTSGSWTARTQDVDRLPVVNGYPDGGFVEDSYDISFAAGSPTTLRFSYSTDPGLARPGWFIDDLQVTAGDQVVYKTDFESGANDPRIFNGGCHGTEQTAKSCTDGWSYFNSSEASSADHAYYLEMRDRSGFDFDGHGENDRAPIGFSPGLLLVYTDEAHCYGNTGCSNPPGQTPLDSQPQPGNDAPALNDAAFTDTAGDNSFSDSGAGHTDNYTDPSSEDVLWHFRFNCLTFNVLSMTGEDVGPATAPGNLQGDVRFTMGSGCGPFDYGFGAPNQKPTAVAQARPTNTTVGQTVIFDGSASFDDLQPSNQLNYQWDFRDGASALGQTATHAYTAPGIYEAVLTVTDAGGLSDTGTVVITVVGAPDLQVTNITANNNRNVREGDKVTVSAIIQNSGSAPAPASKTEFLLDGSTVLGLVDTPILAAGESAIVSVQWDTHSIKGERQIRVTADKLGTVAESNETNNAATLAVTVRGNKVQNGSFEQANAEGNAPANWSGSNTEAGTTTWSEGGSDGSKSASASGNDGNAALAGSPAWTSNPIAVSPGQTLNLRLSVNAVGTSSAASAGLAYLGPAGELLNTVTLITAPLTTGGFRTLEQTVTLPAGVAQVRVVLNGFAVTDLSTSGIVTFDDVGLYEE